MTDLVARLRLETDTGATETDLGAAARSVEQLGEAGQAAAGNLDGASRSADDLAKGLDAAGKTAGTAGAQLRQGAADADAFAQSARSAGAAAKDDLGAALGGLKSTGAKDALDEVGEAAGTAGGALADAAGSAGGTTVAIGGLVGSLIGTAGLALALGVVNSVFDAFNQYEKDMIEGAEVAVTVSGELKKELDELAAEAADLTRYTDDLTTATGSSKDKSLEAAAAYDVQAAAARRAARDIREMTAAELDQELKSLDRQIFVLDRQLNGDGGVFDLVTTDQTERADNSMQDLVGRRMAGFANPNDAAAIANLQSRRNTLSPSEKALLQDYERQEALRASQTRQLEFLEARRDSAREGFAPKAPTASPMFEDTIVVTADSPRGGGGGRRGGGGLSDAERDAQRFLKTAADLERAARLETAALEAQALAAGETSAAQEILRVTQAGLAVQQKLGIENLDDLSEADRRVAQAAIDAAEAAERQAIATEKVKAVAKVTGELDERIAAEEGYAAALAGGETALIAYNLAEAERQALERAGKDLTPEQTEAIKERVRQLARLQAVNEGLEDDKTLAEDLRLIRMTADERDREVRVLELRNRYLREGTALTLEEADARARIVAGLEQETRRRAEDISRLKTGLRAAYIESGEIGFDTVADYAQKRLREAVYDALLAEPIDIVINAAVNVVNDVLAEALGGGAEGGGSPLSLASLFDRDGPAKAVADSMFSGASSIDEMGNSLSSGATEITSATRTLATSLPQLLTAFAPVLGQVAIEMIGDALGFDAKQQKAANLFGVVAGALVGKESNHGARATFGADGLFDISGNKRNRETEDAATGAAKAVLDLIEEMKSIGIEAGGIISSLALGTRDPSKITLANGTEIKTPMGDVEALVKAAGKALLEGATFDNPQMAALVDEMLAANRSFEEIADRLGQFVDAQRLGDDLKLDLLRYTDERAYTLKSLDNAQKARRDQVDEYAAGGFYTDAQLTEIRATLVALESAELAEALGALGEGAEAAARALKEARPRLQEWLDGLGFTDAAQLNPAEERQLAMAQYERMLEKARAGDKTALAGITGAGDRLLDTDQAATSSALERLALYNKVQSDIAALVALSGPITSAALDALGGGTAAGGVSPVVAATEAGTAQLETLTAEVVELRADLVAAIDRLGGDLGETYAGVGNGLAELLERIRETGGSTVQVLEEMARDGRINGALQAATAARIGQ